MLRRIKARAIMLVVLHSILGHSQSAAQALDGGEVRELALRGTWLAQDYWGYWSWSDDNSVCLRLFGPDGDCADTGVWAIEGDVMCYEFTWWGESYDVRKNCFTVHSKGGFHYETRYHGGVLDSVFFSFVVLH